MSFLIETLFLYCCPVCPSCPANAIQMDQAAWEIWAAIKNKPELSSYYYPHWYHEWYGGHCFSLWSGHLGHHILDYIAPLLLVFVP